MGVWVTLWRSGQRLPGRPQDRTPLLTKSKSDGPADSGHRLQRSYPSNCREVWETELSAECCLVSGYADDFADQLVWCAKQYGVTYFKWDAVEQYGCDDPGHHHGGAQMSAQERAERYAFLQPICMSRIVEGIQEEVPEAIVDFEITESARCVGLAFFSMGKYFLTNNPYCHE